MHSVRKWAYVDKNTKMYHPILTFQTRRCSRFDLAVSAEALITLRLKNKECFVKWRTF